MDAKHISDLDEIVHRLRISCEKLAEEPASTAVALEQHEEALNDLEDLIDSQRSLRSRLPYVSSVPMLPDMSGPKIDWQPYVEILVHLISLGYKKHIRKFHA